MKAMKKIVCVLLVAFALTACESMKAAWERDEVKGATIGAGVGAGAGAIIGAATGHTGVGTAIGAGVGALGGGLIGRMMQNQKEELQTVTAKMNDQQSQIDQMKTEQASVKSEGNNLIVNMKGDALFATDSSSLQAGAFNNLREIAGILKKYPDTKVVIKGYTDSVGTDDYNQKLSENRANSVKNVLLGEGVASERITTIGYGKSFPVASNDTPEGRQMNRRVEIVVVPKEEANQS
ncbi:MAG: OmpA family protein [Candidatus Schekmanbacteria bacterium]|nr:OmpA family protein [Candidatus Schekmanbacteria bacterium]